MICCSPSALVNPLETPCAVAPTPEIELKIARISELEAGIAALSEVQLTGGSYSLSLALPHFCSLSLPLSPHLPALFLSVLSEVQLNMALSIICGTI